MLTLAFLDQIQPCFVASVDGIVRYLNAVFGFEERRDQALRVVPYDAVEQLELVPLRHSGACGYMWGAGTKPSTGYRINLDVLLGPSQPGNQSASQPAMHPFSHSVSSQ